MTGRVDPPVTANSERDFTKSYVSATRVMSRSKILMRALDTCTAYSSRIRVMSSCFERCFVSTNVATFSKFNIIDLNAVAEKHRTSANSDSQSTLNDRFVRPITSSSPIISFSVN